MRLHLIFILSLTCGFLQAQSYAFLQWTVADGLPATDVTALAEDDNGYLWVGTNGGGVARFDGKSFTVFSTAEGLSDNFVRSVYSDGRGLTVRTNTGTSRFSAVKNLFSGADAGAEKVEAPEPAAPKNVRLPGGKNLSVTAELKLPSGEQLLGTEDGLYLIGKNGEPNGHFTAPLNLPGTRVRALIQDRQGRVWIATNGGLARMVPSEIQYSPPGKDGPAGRRITDIYAAYDGGLWLALGKDGLQRYDSSRFYPPLTDVVPPRTEITSLNEVPGYGLFITTADRGIYVLNDSLKVSHLTFRDGLPGNQFLTSLPSREEILWAVSYDQGICMIRPADSTFQVENFGPDEDIPLTNFTAATYGPRGNIILGDKLGNVYRWDQEVDTMVAIYGSETGLPRGPVTAMGVRSGTQLWVAVAGYGLYYTDLMMDKVRFAPLPSRFGVMPTDINTILVPQGYTRQRNNNGAEIWLGTDRDLVRIYLDRDGRPDWFRRYGKAEGFPAASVISSAYDGERMWFGTTNGLVSVLPDDADGYVAPPPVNISRIDLFYEPIEEEDYVLENGIPHLAAGNNHLNFRFGAVDLTYPDRVRFQWRLAPYEKEWSPVTDETSVRYTSLSAGNYTFEVRATTDGGKTWGETAEYTFAVATPFWRQGWVWSLMALAGIALMVAAFYFFYRRIQRSEARKREEIEAQNQLLSLEQKALQLQMNPHFIFNALNGIRGLVDGKNDAEARRQIGRFAKLMRGILNNSRRETIPLSQEISTLTEYLEMERFCQPFDFTYTISPPENVDPEEVSMPSMLLQPFLENAVLHGLSPLEGRAGHISVSFIMRGRRMQCTVSDNGIGRNAAAARKASRPTSHKSVALDVTQARLKTMKGRMEVADVLDAEGEVAGTRVELVFPVESW
ncbi:hypothetical protein FUA23_17770 [Neolewinella aurantiaca]|uniref:Two component regulator with propeller domain n=1 Tax=Neolewinella aurantiaca TaxID=2602767 RepID=A0A5C7FNR7_9BACT|nr:histidine kinase [Neolewinella aurantiaca]TXF87659.1 hypothetical protein FUA23_17770 [Neolewinella aurantiaca]